MIKTPRYVTGLFIMSLFSSLIISCTSKPTSLIDIPARITDVSNESRKELRRVVASALHLSNVLLMEDALTKSNILIIERKRLMGLDVNKPKVFRLVKSGSQCVLLLQGTNKRWALRNVQCEPVSPPMRVKLPSKKNYSATVCSVAKPLE